MASTSATHTGQGSPTITTEPEHHHSGSAFRLSSVLLTLLNGNAANGEQKQKKLKMQNAGVKVGEKLYLPGLPVCFCKQIARSNKNGSKTENQELLGKQKISTATTCNAQSITSLCFS